MLVNHINIMDTEGKVYCKKLNKVIVLDFDECSTCDMFDGSAQGGDDRTTQALLRIDFPELELEWLEGVAKRPSKSHPSKNEESFNRLLDKINKRVQGDENS